MLHWYKTLVLWLKGLNFSITDSAPLSVIQQEIQYGKTQPKTCWGPIIIGESILRLLIWRLSRDDEVWLRW